MSDQALPVVTDATGDVRLAREAWERYRHFDGLLRKLRHNHADLKDQILCDLWIAVRAAAGQTPPIVGKPKEGRHDNMKIIIFALALLMPAAAQAATITFWSGDSGTTLYPGACCPGAVTQIAPHAVWGDVNTNAGLPLGTADWVSYANTGSGGFVAPNAASRTVGDETAMFQQALNISSNDGVSGTFNLWILADDTATVTATGPGGPFPLFTAFTGQRSSGPCAPGGTGVPVGCMDADMGITGLSNLTDGLYTLNVYAFQAYEDVFGTQYAGNYSQADPEQTPQPVPEPATLMLLGTGLAGLAYRLRRK